MRDIVEVALFGRRRDGSQGVLRRPPRSRARNRAAGRAIFLPGSAKLLVHERGRARRELRERRIVLLVEPRGYPWGRSAYLRDPDGHSVELNQA